MSEHNLGAMLRHHAQTRPEQAAISFPARFDGTRTTWTTLTFSDVDQQADAFAAGYRRAGLKRGDHVLLAVRPTERFYGMVFGLFRAGLVPVFVDPGLGLRRALDCVADIQPAGLMGMPVVHLASLLYRSPFQRLRVRITDGWRLFWGGATVSQLAASDPNDAPTSSPDPDAEAVIVFTSGSTGTPKGVVLTHGNMAARVEQIQELFTLRAGSTVVESLLVYTILEMAMGLSVVVPHMELSKPATCDPARILEAVDAFSPHVLSASPVVWQRLVRHCEAQDRDLGALELMLTTAAPIPVDLHQRLAALVPEGTELFTPYGATEAMPVARIGSQEILRDTAPKTAAGDGTCVGRRAPEMEIRIVPISERPLTELTSCPPGELGEIVVSGQGVSGEYKGLAAANVHAKIHADGKLWHRMGDIGYLDDADRLWFCGRLSHRLETEHGVVSAVAVEGIGNTHPDVLRTALIGVGQPGAQVGVLAVELEEGRVWSDTLHAALRTRLDASRWADAVAIIAAHPGFPTDARHNSKIRREDLRSWAAAQLERLPETSGQ